MSKEAEVDRADDAEISGADVPADWRSKEDERNPGKDYQSNTLLQDLELRQSPLIDTDPVRRHLKEILEESQAPARQDDQPERLIPEFEMAIPGQIHKRV